MVCYQQQQTRLHSVATGFLEKITGFTKKFTRFEKTLDLNFCLEIRSFA